MAEIEVVAIGDQDRSGKRNIEKETTVKSLLEEMGFDPSRMKKDSVSLDGEIVKDLEQVIPDSAKGVLIAKNAENGDN